MNPALVSQLIQIIQWGITGLLAFKANDAFVGEFTEELHQALLENRPVSNDTWTRLDEAATAANQRLQDA